MEEREARLERTRLKFHESIHSQLYSDEDDFNFFNRIKEQIKEINNKIEVAQAAFTHQELLLTNILCVDPCAEVSQHLSLPYLHGAPLPHEGYGSTSCDDERGTSYRRGGGRRDTRTATAIANDEEWATEHHSSAVPTHSSAVPTHSSAVQPHSSAVPTHSPAAPPHSSAVPPHSSAAPPHSSAVPPHSSAVPPLPCRLTALPCRLTALPCRLTALPRRLTLPCRLMACASFNLVFTGYARLTSETHL
ncbi:USP domain-containing protein [Pycnococcus provasolii]